MKVIPPSHSSPMAGCDLYSLNRAPTRPHFLRRQAGAGGWKVGYHRPAPGPHEGHDSLADTLTPTLPPSPPPSSPFCTRRPYRPGWPLSPSSQFLAVAIPGFPLYRWRVLNAITVVAHLDGVSAGAEDIAGDFGITLAAAQMVLLRALRNGWLTREEADGLPGGYRRYSYTASPKGQQKVAWVAENDPGRLG